MEIGNGRQSGTTFDNIMACFFCLCKAMLKQGEWVGGRGGRTSHTQGKWEGVLLLKRVSKGLGSEACGTCQDQKGRMKESPLPMWLDFNQVSWKKRKYLQNCIFFSITVHKY